MLTENTQKAAEKSKRSLVSRLRKWTVAEYYQLAEGGYVGFDIKTELIDGIIVHTPAVSALHLAFQTYLTQQFHHRDAYRDYLVCGRQPLTLDDYNEPVVDVYLVPHRTDYYATGKPTAKDALLICEVSVSSLNYDLGDKVKRYARSAVPEYWVVDAKQRQLHYFEMPSPAGYRKALILERGDTFVSKLLGETTVDAWMPPPPTATD